MDDRFFEAWITRQSWRVCGLRLQPLCLGHLVNLHAVASPVLDPTARVFPGDLIVAARICAETWPHPGKIRPRLRDIVWRLLMENPRLGPGFLRHQSAIFSAYWHDHTSFPEFWKREESAETGRTLTAPEALSKACYLLAHTSLTEERIWSMALGRIDYHIGTIEERRAGSIRFLREDDLEAPEAMEDEHSEDEITAIARQDLSPPDFIAWQKARKQSAIRNPKSEIV